MIKTFAAIDVGSFELELGIYEISSKSGIRQIDHIRHTIALGKDTYNDGKISYGLVDEMCAVLLDFSGIMKAYKVDDYRAYGSSAMREARNNQIVLDQIRVRTGIEVRIISNSEHRLISYKAVASREGEFHKIIQKGTAIADVGFGSMQMSLFDKDTLVTTQNMPLGVLRIRGILNHVPATVRVQQNLVEEMVENELATFRKMYLKDREIKNLIGIGETIVGMVRHIEHQDLKNKITTEEFRGFCNKLKDMNGEKIQETFDLNAEYASMVMPVALIYKRILEMTGAEMVWIPAIRMTDGIAAEYADDIRAIKFSHSFDEDIIAASRNMAKRYKCHMLHVQTVEKAALQIFDSTKKYHGLKSRERLLLQIAANLHSCGKYISIRDASECCYNIIMSTEIIGLSHLEREVVANVVRYHVQDFRYNEIHVASKPYHGDRLSFQGDVSILIAKLTAILRLANSMDRSHKQKLQDCRMSVKDTSLIISAEYGEDLSLEQMSIERRADFFEEIFGIRPELKQKRRV